MRWLGLVMGMGPVTAIQADSPAAAADIRVGDFVRTIDGKSVGDPLRLPDRLRGRAGETVKLGILRDGKESLEISVKLRETDAFYPPLGDDSPVAIPALGLAYRVSNRVQEAAAGTPAAAAGLKAGDVLVKATVFPPNAEMLKKLRKSSQDDDLEQPKRAISFDDQQHNWPYVAMYLLQTMLPGTTVELQYSRDDKTVTSKPLELVVAKDWFNPERGMFFAMKTFTQTADSFGAAVRLGGKKTLDSTLAVYQMIHSMGSGNVSPRNLGGPITIFWAALQRAKAGVGSLLLFLTLLSANLAVLNFLPIPLLDGGHMVMLLWEGVSGKPVDERVQLALTYCGLLLLLALMLWVFGLDLSLIARPGR
jgi:regulator of sigma E protease